MARSGTSGGCTADTIARDWLPTIAPVVVRSPLQSRNYSASPAISSENTPSGAPG